MHLTGEDSPVPGYHLKMSTALAGIYFFYVSERALKTFMKRNKNKVSLLVYEPRCEKTGLRGFLPGPTQIRLYNHRR